jgi:hypothetical protein
MVVIVLVKNAVPLSLLLVASASAMTFTSASAPFASVVAPLILLWRAGRALVLVRGIRDFAARNENSTLVHGGGCHLMSTNCHGMLGWGPQAVSHELYQASSGM